jgi:hypothetical protein
VRLPYAVVDSGGERLNSARIIPFRAAS